ncbi:MAG: glycoside hydrolase family 31 protein, partial [Eubacteriales bacterium]|nr:glycoside hydrolase family 31 protein [Eubacteriales bacterium]
MIKHLGEQLVPFADSGFARTPEMPVVGEAVRVCCETRGAEEEPVLTLQTEADERSLRAAETEASRYTFLLGAFDKPQTVRYRFATASEQTGWYSFDVTTLETVEKPIGLYRDGGALRLALSEDVTLTLRGGDTLEMALSQTGVQGTPCTEAVLALPGQFSIHLRSDSLWELNRLSEPVARGVRYLLWRNAKGRVVKTELQLSLACEKILGTGERFSAVNRMGREAGGQVAEKFTHQGDHTYLPVPFFLTEKGFGWYRQSDIPADMRFGEVSSIRQEAEGEALACDRLYFGAPCEVLGQFAAQTGEPVLPPEWAFGVWISGNGWSTDAEVDAQLAALKRYDYPASVMVLEQWSDERTFYRWHAAHWRDPAAMVARVRAAGLHMVLWQIPIVKHEWDGEPGEALLRDIDEAVSRGYVVRNADGEPYHITDNWFHHSLLMDFTNPEAVKWWFDKRKPLLQMGVEGFKTDGGEFLFEKGAKLHNGGSGLANRNPYPMQYLTAYRDFMRENGVNGVLFSRAGYTGAQTAPIHWAGDQASEWGEFRAQLNAGLSAGLSGVLFWSFDIGGFAGPIPSAELYLRATAMGCFCPVMQWHAEPRNGQFSGGMGEAYNNDRSPWNLAEKLGDERVLTVACEFARIRENLRP